MPVEHVSAVWLKSLAHVFCQDWINVTVNDAGDTLIDCRLNEASVPKMTLWMRELKMEEQNMRALVPKDKFPAEITMSTIALCCHLRLELFTEDAKTVKDALEELSNDEDTALIFKTLGKMTGSKNPREIMSLFLKGFCKVMANLNRVDEYLKKGLKIMAEIEDGVDSLKAEVSQYALDGDSTKEQMLEKKKFIHSSSKELLSKLTDLNHTIDPIWSHNESKILSHCLNDDLAKIVGVKTTKVKKTDLDLIKEIAGNDHIMERRISQDGGTKKLAVYFFTEWRQIWDEVNAAVATSSQKYNDWLRDNPQHQQSSQSVGYLRANSVSRAQDHLDFLARDEILNEDLSGDTRSSNSSRHQGGGPAEEQPPPGTSNTSQTSNQRNNRWNFGRSGGGFPGDSDPDDEGDDHGNRGGGYRSRRDTGDSQNNRRNENMEKARILKQEVKFWVNKVRPLLNDPMQASLAHVGYYIDEGKVLASSAQKAQLDQAMIINLAMGDGSTMKITEVLAENMLELKKLHSDLTVAEKSQFENKKRYDSLLKDDGLRLDKLESVKDILSWIHGVENILKVTHAGNMMLSSEKIKKSLNQADYKAVQHVTDVNEILRIINDRYSSDSKVFRSSLNEIRNLPDPKAIGVAQDNYRFIEERIREVLTYKIEKMLTAEDLDICATKTFVPQELIKYKATKSKFIRASAENQKKYLGGDKLAIEMVTNQRSNPLLLTRAEIDRASQQDPASVRSGSKTLSTLIDNICRSENTVDLEHLRLFYCIEAHQYICSVTDELNSRSLEAGAGAKKPFARGNFRGRGRGKVEEKEDKSVHVLIAQNQTPPGPMSSKSQGFRPENHQGSYGGRGRGRGGRGNWNRNGGNQDLPMKDCPLNCGKQHPLGSARFCDKFKQMNLKDRLELCSKIKLLNLCCLRINAHKKTEPCRANKGCYWCKQTNHASLLCKHPSAQHTLLAQTEQEDSYQEEDALATLMDEADISDWTTNQEDQEQDQEDSSTDYQLEDQQEDMDSSYEDNQSYDAWTGDSDPESYSHFMMVRTVQIMDEDAFFDDPSIHQILSNHEDYYDEGQMSMGRPVHDQAVQTLATCSQGGIMSYLDNSPTLSATLLINQLQPQSEGSLNISSSSIESLGSQNDEEARLEEMVQFAEDTAKGKIKGIENLIADYRKEEDKESSGSQSVTKDSTGTRETVIVSPVKTEPTQAQEQGTNHRPLSGLSNRSADMEDRQVDLRTLAALIVKSLRIQDENQEGKILDMIEEATVGKRKEDDPAVELETIEPQTSTPKDKTPASKDKKETHPNGGTAALDEEEEEPRREEKTPKSGRWLVPLEKSKKPVVNTALRFNHQLYNVTQTGSVTCKHADFVEISEQDMGNIEPADFQKIRSAGVTLRSMYPDQLSCSFESWLKIPSTTKIATLKRQGMDLKCVDHEFFVKIRVIFDTGSQSNLIRATVFSSYCTPTNGEAINIVGIDGKMQKALPGLITLRGYTGRDITLPVNKHNFNIPDTSLSTPALEKLAKMSFGTDSEVFGKQNAVIDLVLGMESKAFCPRDLTPEQLVENGFRYPVESPNLTLSTCELAADGCFVSGVFGINPDLAELSSNPVLIPDTKMFNLLRCSISDTSVGGKSLMDPRYINIRKGKSPHSNPSPSNHIQPVRLDHTRTGAPLDSKPPLPNNTRTSPRRMGRTTTYRDKAWPLRTPSKGRVKHALMTITAQRATDAELGNAPSAEQDSDNPSEDEQGVDQDDEDTASAAEVMETLDHSLLVSTKEDLKHINMMSAPDILLETKDISAQENLDKQEEWTLLPLSDPGILPHKLGKSEDENILLMNQLIKSQLKVRAETDICVEHLGQTLTCHNCQHAHEMSVDDLILQNKIKDGMRIMDDPDTGKKYFLFSYITRDDPDKIFSPGNSNYQEALSNAQQVRRKLLKMDGDMLDKYHATITEALDMGFMAKLSQEEVDSLKDRNHYFIFQNVVVNEKSSSTPLRRISDTSRPIKGMLTTHSHQITSPQGSLNNLTQCHLRFLIYQPKVNLDVSKAYKRLRICESSQYLCLTVWFTDPHNPDTVCILRDTAVSFGIAQAATCLQLSSDYCANQLTSPTARDTAINSILADDMKDSSDSVDQLLADTREIRAMYDSYSLTMKPPVSNLWVDPDQLTNESRAGLSTNTFGTTQHFYNDTMIPSATLSAYPSKRGKSGAHLEDTDIFNVAMLILTLRVMTRVAAQLYCISGQMLGVAIATAKRWISQIHQASPGKTTQWDLDITSFDPELDMQLRTFLNSIKFLKRDLKPFLNFVIPHNYRFRYMIISRDGSKDGASITCHVVSKKTKQEEKGPKYFSYILYAKDILATDSVPVNEAASLRLSMESLTVIMSALYHKLEKGTSQVRIYLLGDSKAISYSLSNSLPIRNISIRNRINASKLMALNLTLKYKKLAIYTGWIPGSLNISDWNSKVSQDPIKDLNHPYWRHGYPFFTSKTRVEEHLFWSVKAGLECYKPLPLAFLDTKQDKDQLAICDEPFTKKPKPTPPLKNCQFLKNSPCLTSK